MTAAVRIPAATSWLADRADDPGHQGRTATGSPGGALRDLPQNSVCLSSWHRHCRSAFGHSGPELLSHLEAEVPTGAPLDRRPESRRGDRSTARNHGSSHDGRLYRRHDVDRGVPEEMELEQSFLFSQVRRPALLSDPCHEALLGFEESSAERGALHDILQEGRDDPVRALHRVDAHPRDRCGADESIGSLAQIDAGNGRISRSLGSRIGRIEQGRAIAAHGADHRSAGDAAQQGRAAQRLRVIATLLSVEVRV